MFFEDVSNNLRVFLNSKLDFLVIPDYDNGNEPIDAYGTIGITLARQIEGDHNGTWEDSEGFKEHLKKDYEIILTMNFYGEGCYANAHEALNLFGFQSNQDALYSQYKIAYVGHSQVRRQPEMRSTKFVPRASVDITCYASLLALNELDWFNKVSYQGKYLTIDGTVVLTQEGTVDITTT